MRMMSPLMRATGHPWWTLGVNLLTQMLRPSMNPLIRRQQTVMLHPSRSLSTRLLLTQIQ
jgi:hypothetical protein